MGGGRGPKIVLIEQTPNNHWDEKYAMRSWDKKTPVVFEKQITNLSEGADKRRKKDAIFHLFQNILQKNPNKCFVIYRQNQVKWS